MGCVKKTRHKPVALTIAGSDPVGGAGLQAGLKTFAALDVHGTTVITCVTAQNTHSILAIEAIKPDMIRKQISALVEDIDICAAKTGLLPTKETITTVSDAVSHCRFPLVVDPVMVAKSGAPLLSQEAIDALRDCLLPRAAVVTPNRREAEKLTDMEINTICDAQTAARKISQMGPETVVIKCSHMDEQDVVDVLYHGGEFRILRGPRFKVRTIRGTGCSFSAAITAELAKSTDVPTAVENAKKFVALAVEFGSDLGKGYGPVNPMAHLFCRFREK